MTSKDVLTVPDLLIASVCADRIVPGDLFPSVVPEYVHCSKTFFVQRRTCALGDHNNHLLPCVPLFRFGSKD
jgi:hypothetical protein